MRRQPALPFALPVLLSVLLSSSLAFAQGAPAPATPEVAEPTAADVSAATDEAAPASDLHGKLLVLDLVDRGAGPELTRSLSDALGTQAGRSSRDVVLTVGEVRTKLDAAALAALTGCDAEGCMQDLATAVSADRVLGGSAAVVGGDVVLTVVLVDARTGERLGEAQRKAPAHPALATYAARAVTAKALGAAALGEPVPVLLDSDPPGARAFVDGSSVGSTPVVAPLTPGAHEVTFRADGHDDQKLGLSVEDGAPVALHAALTRPTIRLWPIAAALGGVAVLAGAGAGWAGISAANSYDGSFGFFTPEEDLARSYLYASPTDSMTLAAKQQQIEQLALLANVLWITAAGAAAAAIVVEGVDVGLWAFTE